MAKSKLKVRVLVFPKWLMHKWSSHPLAFCSVKRTVIGTAFLLVSIELLLALMYILSKGLLPFHTISLVALSTVGSIFVFFSYLYYSRTLVISSDCFKCQFSFHIIAHETTHITTNWHDEKKVEEETLRKTRDTLMTLLQSNPKLCKYCAFKRKFYKQELEKYLIQQKTTTTQ